MPGNSLPVAQFRLTFRGYDAEEVRRYVQEVGTALTAAESERDRLAQRLAELGDRDLTAEFDRVASDLQRILTEAQATADGLRLRAAQETEQWRAEARTEADARVLTANEDAEGLRREAWKTAEQLIEQAAEEAERIRQGAERDALSILGEAEREAHRTVSAARRESEDTVRVSKMEAERLLAEGRSQHDEIIDEARREAEAAQERARALEVRRTELLMELEGVRSTIQRLESQIDQRVAPPEAAEPVGVATSDQPRAGTTEGQAGDESTEWGTEENVRIVPAPGGRTAAPLRTETAVDATQMAAEVRRLREAKPQVEPVEPVAEAEPESEVSEEAEPIRVPQAEVDELFARLRVTAPPEQPGEEARPTPPGRDQFQDRSVMTSDPAEVQAKLLVPVINERLRNVKRRLTDTQSLVLEELHEDPAWSLSPERIAAALGTELESLAHDAFTAGLRGAAQLYGTEIFDLEPPPRVATEEFVSALTADLATALERGRSGDPAVVGGIVSRTFRTWRIDQSERRVASLAEAAYQEGLRAALSEAGIDTGLEVAPAG